MRRHYGDEVQLSPMT